MDASADRLLGLALCAFLPALMYLAVVRWLDRYEREPWSSLAAAFAWGGTGAIVGGGASTVLLTIPAVFTVGAAGADFLSMVVFAPLTEEAAKGLFLLAFATRREFDGFVDGVVYGVAVGLGFAAVENLLYFHSTPAGPGLVALFLVRTGGTMVGHALATSCTGGALGAAKYSRAHWLVRVVMVAVGFGLAVILHGLWNLSMVLAEGAEAAELVVLALFGLVATLGTHMLALQLALRGEAAQIARELAAEAPLVPPALAACLKSYRRRFGHLIGLVLRLRWFAAWRFLHLVRDGTELAVRRAQARHDSALLPEVEQLRTRVRAAVAGGWQ